MIGRVPEGDDYSIIAQGDWRTAAGEVIPYDKERGGNVIVVSGAEGQYLFYRGEWIAAIDAWRADLDFIARIEQEQVTRLHKGWFYYQIARASHQLAKTYDPLYMSQYEEYLELARREDAMSYGDKAAMFPSADPIPEHEAVAA